jgi:4-hydroxy-tetrahydrodipicolinate synthase
LPETVKRIAEEAKMVRAIKEAAGDLEQVMDLVEMLPDDFLVLSGDDPLLVPHMACGGHGIISVVGNAFPLRFREIYEACLSGDYEKARSIHYRLRPLIASLFAEGNPGGIKEVLKHLGICGNRLRLPLFPVSEELSDRIARQIAVLNN